MPLAQSLEEPRLSSAVRQDASRQRSRTYPEDISVTCSPNHLSNVPTMQGLMSHLNARATPDGEQRAWLCFLDLCPLHVSEALQSWVRRVMKTLPYTQCFV